MTDPDAPGAWFDEQVAALIAGPLAQPSPEESGAGEVGAAERARRFMLSHWPTFDSDPRAALDALTAEFTAITPKARNTSVDGAVRMLREALENAQRDFGHVANSVQMRRYSAARQIAEGSRDRARAALAEGSGK